MLVDLSHVLKTEGVKVTKEAPVEMTSFESGMGTFPVISASPVALAFSNIGSDKVRVEGNVKLAFQANCDRCLTEVSTVLDLKVDRVAAVLGKAEEEADELALSEDCKLDTEALVRNEILINWPTKILCKEDCRGICPICGRNLNTGDCGCDTFVPDPRMAVIQDIFNKNKEV